MESGLNLAEIIINITWFLCGGLIMGLCWIVMGVIWCVTMVGKDYGLHCFKIASIVMLPYGREVVDGDSFAPQEINYIWMATSGVLLMIINVLFCAILSATVLGIPFGRLHLRFGKIALAPFRFDIP